VSSSDKDTTRSTPFPTILVVGCSPGFASRCEPAARLAGVIVRQAPTASWPTQAARFRPLAIVVPTARHRADRETFEDVAKAVIAEIVIVREEDVSADVLQTLIPLAVLAAQRRRTAYAQTAARAVWEKGPPSGRAKPPPSSKRRGKRR
jgi:hypothetical protein